MTLSDVLWRVVGSLAIIGGSALVGGWLSVIASMAATRRGVSGETSRALETGIPALAVGLGVVFAVEFLFGLPMVSVGATFGAVLVAAALACVPVLANLVAGLAFQLREHPRVGVSLRSDGFEGAITAMDWLGVRIASRRDSEVLLPWLWLLVRPVEVRGDEAGRPIGVPVILGAGTDLERVRELLVAAARGIDGVLEDPPPDLIVREVTARGVPVLLRASVDASRGTEVRSAVVAAVAAALHAAEIEVAA